jgi:hypothetical protein
VGDGGRIRRQLCCDRVRGGCKHDDGKHEQHGVCEERHFNDPAKRTRDLERARREEHIYI